MPSKTFFNLDIRKQKKLIHCSLLEFSKNSYSDVSINRIIKNAQISRGSFYMYFTDKEDLFMYIINSYNEKLSKIVRNNLSLYKGNLRLGFVSIYDDIMSVVGEFKYKGFFKNAFMFFDLNKNHYTNPVHTLYTEVKDIVDFSNIEYEDKEFLFAVFMQNLISNLAIALREENRGKNREYYLKKIDILCYGIYKKEDK